jgi:putative ABC transport system substrate-binding protein
MIKREPKIVVFLRRDFTLHTGVSAALYREIFREWPYPLIPGVHVCAEANDEVIGTQIEEVLTSEYDVAVTIGTLYSQMVATHIRELGSSMKQLCVAVKDPQELGLIDSFESPGKNITAVVRDHAPSTQMLELLLLLRPEAKKIMFPYFPFGDGGRMSDAASVACAYLERQGIEVLRVAFYRHNDFSSVLIPELDNVDAVFLIESGYLTDELLKLVAACCEKGVTCCVSDIDGIPAGAAIVFGQDMGVVGRAAYEQLIKLLEHGDSDAMIPVKEVPNGRKLYVNKGMALEQGLLMDSIGFFMLDNAVVIDEDLLSLQALPKESEVKNG